MTSFVLHESQYVPTIHPWKSQRTSFSLSPYDLFLGHCFPSAFGFPLFIILFTTVFLFFCSRSQPSLLAFASYSRKGFLRVTYACLKTSKRQLRGKPWISLTKLTKISSAGSMKSFIRVAFCTKILRYGPVVLQLYVRLWSWSHDRPLFGSSQHDQSDYATAAHRVDRKFVPKDDCLIVSLDDQYELWCMTMAIDQYQLAWTSKPLLMLYAFCSKNKRIAVTQAFKLSKKSSALTVIVGGKTSFANNIERAQNFKSFWERLRSTFRRCGRLGYCRRSDVVKRFASPFQGHLDALHSCFANGNGERACPMSTRQPWYGCANVESAGHHLSWGRRFLDFRWRRSFPHESNGRCIYERRVHACPFPRQ